MTWTETAIAAAKWPFKQVWGGAKRAWTWATARLSPTDVIYPALWAWVMYVAQKAIDLHGTRSAGKQLEGAAVTAVTVAASTFWTGPLMIALLAWTALFAAVGILRFIPAVNDAWTRFWPFYGINTTVYGGA